MVKRGSSATISPMTAGTNAAKYAAGMPGTAQKEVATIPGRNVILRAKSGDRILAERKAARVNPGEMCHIEIACEEIGDIVVEVFSQEGLR